MQMDKPFCAYFLSYAYVLKPNEFSRERRDGNDVGLEHDESLENENSIKVIPISLKYNKPAVLKNPTAKDYVVAIENNTLVIK